MATPTGNTKGIAVVLTELNYECLEVHYPRLRLIEAGYTVYVAGPKAGETYTSKEGTGVIMSNFIASNCMLREKCHYS
jgi:hypothetical protein